MVTRPAPLLKEKMAKRENKTAAIPSDWEDGARPVQPVSETSLAAPAAPSNDLPKDFAESLIALKKAENLPEGTRQEKASKAQTLKAIREHVGRIQQGLPQIVIDANALVNAPGLNNRIVQAERLEARSRGDQDIAYLLEENQKLKAQLEGK